MVLIDTSIWIEYFKVKEPYYSKLAKLLETNEVLAFSPIFGELLQGAKNKRERSIILEFWEYLPKLDEKELFISAGLESSLNKWLNKGIGLIDSTIILIARKNSHFIWTKDKKVLSVLQKEEIFN